MVMAVLMKEKNKERNYVGWSGVLLLFYAGDLMHISICILVTPEKPDLEIVDLSVITSILKNQIQAIKSTETRDEWYYYSIALEKIPTLTFLYRRIGFQTVQRDNNENQCYYI